MFGVPIVSTAVIITSPLQDACVPTKRYDKMTRMHASLNSERRMKKGSARKDGRHKGNGQDAELQDTKGHCNTKDVCYSEAER